MRPCQFQAEENDASENDSEEYGAETGKIPFISNKQLMPEAGAPTQENGANSSSKTGTRQSTVENGSQFNRQNGKTIQSQISDRGGREVWDVREEKPFVIPGFHFPLALFSFRLLWSQGTHGLL